MNAQIGFSTNSFSKECFSTDSFGEEVIPSYTCYDPTGEFVSRSSSPVKRFFDNYLSPLVKGFGGAVLASYAVIAVLCCLVKVVSVICS